MVQSLKIMMVAQFYPPIHGGEEAMVRDLSTELANRGHRVSVVTLAHETAPPSEVIDGVHVHRIASSTAKASILYTGSRRHAPPAPDPGATAALRRVFLTERPDVVHGHNWLVYSYLPLARRHRETALVLSLHDYSHVCATKRFVHRGAPCSGPGLLKCGVCSWRHYRGPKGPSIAALNAGAAAYARRFIDLFLPVSRAVAVGTGLARHRQRYEVIPNFLPDDFELNGVDSPLESLPKDFLLFVGDATEDKGVRVLLEAHASMREPVPLVMIGRHHESELVRNCHEGVVLLGSRPRENVIDAWRRCSAAVVPSITPEAFGLVALEAMALGRPVVASRVGGLQELVTEGRTGMLVPPRDVRALRDALEQLARDQALRDRLGAEGKRRAGAFMASRVVPRFEAAYEHILRARRRGR